MTIDTSTRGSTVRDQSPYAVCFAATGDVAEDPSQDDKPCTRIRAADLRDAMRQSARSRDNSTRDAAVLIDIDVIIDDDAGEALRRYDRIDPRLRVELATTLHYVGTPAGLAGLVSDIRRLNIADGVVVVPVHQSPEQDAAPPSRFSSVPSARR